MELPLPTDFSPVFKSSPIQQGTKSVTEFEPFRMPFLSRMARICVYPVLERIDGRNPGQDRHDSFQVISDRSLCLFVRIKFVEEIMGQKFHGHCSNFTEFQWSTAIIHQWDVICID